MNDQRSIAYFSMEIEIKADVPTYSGGLGVLAGDTLRAAADLELPILAVTLLQRQGYFHQRLSADGWQIEEPVHWSVDDILTQESVQVSIPIDDRTVTIQAWRYDIIGMTGHKIPVYFIDADVPGNSNEDRGLTGSLYGSDTRYRLMQEVLLGIGGVRLLSALNHHNIKQYHLNEGHAALLAFELLYQQTSQEPTCTDFSQGILATKKKCVFTTHTPVPAGHDKFDYGLVRAVLLHHPGASLLDNFLHDGKLNMTYLALELSHYVNGVAEKHGDVSRKMFNANSPASHYDIDAITNGIHSATWVSDPIRKLLDKYLPTWTKDHRSIRYGINIRSDELWDAHQDNKIHMIRHLNKRANSGFDKDIFTIGFTRRFTAYKRPLLILQDIERLKYIGKLFGGIQLVFAGKAHPHDDDGKRSIQRIWNLRSELSPHVAIVFLENYGVDDAKMLVSGVDLWLNTPQPPMEASGTSGMKAAINAVPSLSVLDGWWLEGCIEGVTGWSIGSITDDCNSSDLYVLHANSLYEKLEHEILPLYYTNTPTYIKVMRNALALNGSFFNTHRMLQQYAVRAYKLNRDH